MRHPLPDTSVIASIVLPLAMIACIALAPRVMAASSDAADPPRRDEFGVVPEDPEDSELSLPDPVLDRNWPMPVPGAPGAKPQRIAPDEAEIDPFAEENVRPHRPEPEPEDGGIEEGLTPPRKPAPALAPDGKPDGGIPVPAAAPAEPDILEPEIREETELEQEENGPSPLEKDDQEFDRESGDPGEW